MATWEYPVSEPAEVRVRIPDGDITVTAAPTETVTVEVTPSGRSSLDDIDVDFDAGVVSVIARKRTGLMSMRSGSFDVDVTVPEGSACRVDTAAGDVDCRGELGSLIVTTASGDTNAERVSGTAEVSTASGDVRLGRAGDVQAKTVSGDVHVDTAGGDVTCHSVSGDVWVGQVRTGYTKATTTSGDITVTVVPGLNLRLDLSTLSGDMSSELAESGGDGEIAVTLTCHTLSGDIRLKRAS
ncbi:MAG TPA: DUF4097 family beta strand repeat-containing protein [Streptosporangiaceae bacterium]|nr:DUF4097 family beta strand repeat-containing protein [Streptosporangiaceae bacterium]